MSSLINEPNPDNSRPEQKGDWHENFARYQVSNYYLQKQMTRYWKFPIAVLGDRVTAAADTACDATRSFIYAEAAMAKSDEEFARGVLGLLRLDAIERAKFLTELTGNNDFNPERPIITSEEHEDLIESIGFAKRDELLEGLVTGYVDNFTTDINRFFSEHRFLKYEVYKKVGSGVLDVVKITSSALLAAMVVKRSMKS